MFISLPSKMSRLFRDMTNVYRSDKMLIVAFISNRLWVIRCKCTEKEWEWDREIECACVYMNNTKFCLFCNSISFFHTHIHSSVKWQQFSIEMHTKTATECDFDVVANSWCFAVFRRVDRIQMWLTVNKIWIHCLSSL